MKIRNLEQEEVAFTASANQSAASAPQSAQRRKPRRGRGLFTLVLLAAIVALGWGYYTKNQEVEALKNPEVKAAMEQKEIEALVALVSKIILLPTGESPQVLTINDAEAAIKQQAAFTGSINGDKVLIYSKASKAFIYSPSRNIIVNVLPVTLSNEAASPAATQTTSAAQPSTAAKDTSKNSTANGEASSN